MTSDLFPKLTGKGQGQNEHLGEASTGKTPCSLEFGSGIGAILRLEATPSLWVCLAHQSPSRYPTLVTLLGTLQTCEPGHCQAAVFISQSQIHQIPFA